MHIIQEEIGLPKITIDSKESNLATLSMEPLPNGYGMTLGNSLRRVLLSSLPGTAVIAVRVEGASHEYTAFPGMKETVLDFILSLKNVAFNKHSKGREVLKLEKKGEGPVKASDISSSADTEILNPDYVITNLTGKDTKLSVDIIVEKSVGYVPAKERMNEEDLLEYIHTDAIFSPVSQVRYNIESARVGENTDLDKLILEVETNGSMAAEDAIKFSSDLLSSYFSIFNQDQEAIEPDFKSDATKAISMDDDEEERESYTPIEILNFSPRTLNALINGEIGSIEQLVKCSPNKLQSLRGFGKKAMDEVDEALEKRGLALLSDD